MQKTLDAIYEHGVFRPLQHPEIPEGQRVQLVVQGSFKESPEDLLALASQVYEGLPESLVDDIEKIALSRRVFFGERPLS